ncbi:MAG: alpha-L-fucosidase [Planctomycetota bacterium]
MSARYLFALVLCVSSLVALPAGGLANDDAAAGPYEPTWESLRRHTPAPEWFRDAKFGIYFHWGVYSVPAFGNEWYPRWMHAAEGYKGWGSPVRKHHLETYGTPAEYPYDKFVPQFTAENFDAEEWADLFVKAGARFAGPVAEHHDGFAMWDSELTPWNAADRGPRRDITGEMAAAAKARGLKFVATFHHARNLIRERSEPDKWGFYWDGHYGLAKETYPEVFEDPERAFLYGDMPADQFYDLWLGKLDEVIAKYEPDLIWFDSWLDSIPEEYRRQFLANYFNHAERSGQDVLVTFKQEDLPGDVAVFDIEKGGMGELTDFPWLTDDTISLGSWCWTQDLRIKETSIVLHSLIDIVSKNGQLLLNISPKADGTIPQDQRDVLLELGAWLEVHGEAIYETRPFVTYGHGPTKPKKGRHGGFRLTDPYTPQDVRYTRNGDTVYAFQLGEPEAGSTVVLEAFAAADGGAAFDVEDVEILGTGEEVAFEQTAAGLVLTVPSGGTDPLATVYKIELD